MIDSHFQKLFLVAQRKANSSVFWYAFAKSLVAQAKRIGYATMKMYCKQAFYFGVAVLQACQRGSFVEWTCIEEGLFRKKLRILSNRSYR